MAEEDLKKKIAKIKSTIKRCKQSPAFFVDSFCKIKHPNAGIIPFQLFSYQRKCLDHFQKHRFNIFGKTRQCFAAGSMVWTPNGPVPIEKLKTGDEIYTFNIENSSLETTKISNTFDNNIRDTMEVRNKNGHKSICTYDHKFLTTDGWVEAKNLTQNHMLIEINPQKLISEKGKILSTKPLFPQRVYDLEVPPHNNFIVDGVVVHNSGISTLCGAYALWLCMFFKMKTVLIVSKRDLDAKEFMARNIKFTYTYLPEWMKSIWVPIINNEHQIGFNNGSKISSLPSGPDTLRANSSSLNIIDEAAFCPHMNDMWCLAPNSLVPTKNGIKELKDIKIDDEVVSVDGTNKCLKTHNRSSVAVKEIITTGGHNITAGLNHRFISDGKWIKVKDLKMGSPLTLKANWTEESELSEKVTQQTFLRDLFSADGFISNTDQKPTFKTASKMLINKIQVMLLGLGIYSNISKSKSEFVLRIADKTSKSQFAKQIGFIQKDKQKIAERNIIDCHPHVSRQVKIKSMIDNVIDVNDISVTGDNSYISNGFISHNSGGYPTLQHGGCQHFNSIVLTKNGLEKLGSLGDSQGEEWQDINIDVATDFGIEKATKFYINNTTKDGPKPVETKIITTNKGYESECSLTHRFRIIRNGQYVWEYAPNIKIGDIIPIKTGGFPDNNKDKKLIKNLDSHGDNVPDFSGLKNKDNIDVQCADCKCVNTIRVSTLKSRINRRKDQIYYCQSCGVKNSSQSPSNEIELPNTLDPWFAEWLGLYMGDGWTSGYRVGISCDAQDKDTIEYIYNIFENKFKTKPWKEEWKGSVSVRIGGTSLIKYLETNGLKKESSEFAFVPKQILTGSKESLRAFLRGAFESDGSITQTKNGSNPRITISSISKQFLCDIHIALLSLGIVGTLEKVKHNKGHWGNKQMYRINISEIKHIINFRNEIGFIGSRKQNRLNNVTIKHKTLCGRKQRLISESVDFDTSNFYFDEVKSIKKSSNLTYDLSVPNGNTYISNGFVSHNSLIVVSTSNGIGDWYWKTWSDAQDSHNEFNPIKIDWWEMDWAIEYQDDVSKNPIRIAPTDNMRRCKTKDEIARYGEYWSPWLETQYKQLTEKGNDSKFRQEVLRDFLGSGNTVLSRDTLLMMRAQATEAGKNYKTVNHVDYVQPIISESYHLDFQDRLWIWNEPEKDHLYVIGADISSGESSDWSAVQIFDIVTSEQVAELQIKVKPKIFSVMIDYLGRWYNNAFLVPERTGMGVTVCQDLEEFAYPNIFRKNMLPSASKKPLISTNKGSIGYNTTGVGKPILNKSMIDNFGENGFKIKSYRLVSQAETYVHLGTNKTGAEKGTMNDDLVMAAGLAFVGINMAISRENCSLIPFSASISFGKPGERPEHVTTNDFTAISPILSGKNPMPGQTQEEEMIKFSQSLMSPMMDSQMPSVVKKKNTLPGSR